MALLTWSKNLSDKKVNLKFNCHYKNGLIVELDSHDMTDNINEIFNSKELDKMDYLELPKYLFSKLSNLSSVEIVTEKSISEYFSEDISEL